MENHVSSDPPCGLLLSDDLIFTSRITGTARDLGLAMKVASSAERLRALIETEVPTCLIVDLANPGLVIEDLMTWLRKTCVPVPRVVAYGAHVDTETLRRAREAGCDPVLPRSKFVEELPTKLLEWIVSSSSQATNAAGGQMTFDQVWDAVQALDVEQLRRIRNLADSLMANPSLRRNTGSLEKLDQATLLLLRDGVISRIPPPPSEEYIQAFRQYQPVSIEGKPLSETIIEDRR